MSKYDNYKQYGDELRFNYCPICKREKDNPDFTVNVTTGQYYCHSTGQGGNISEIEDFDMDLIKNVKVIETPAKEKAKDFTEFFKNQIQNHLGQDWIDYLKGRGISEKFLNTFCRKGKYNSMMIPIVDEKGKIVSIKYRTLDKKLSSEPGSLTNYFVNWHNVKDFSYVIIVEGEIDLLSCVEADCYNVISLPFGAKNVKCVDNQKLWLEKFEKIIIATDNDDPGRDGKERIKTLLSSISHKLYEVDLGKYKDFNEVLQAEGTSKVKEIVENATNIEIDKSIFYGERGKFLFFKFAEYLKGKYKIVKIDNELYQYNGKIYAKGEEIQKLMIKEIEELSSRQRKEILEYLKLIAPPKIRNDNGVVAFNNGIYSILEDKLYPFSPDFVITNQISWNYNPNIYSELMDHTLNKFICSEKDARNLLEEIIGYIFFTKNELGKAFVIVGDKANGKSTFLKILSHLIGKSNVSALNLDDITNSRFRLYQVANKLLNIGDDIGSGYIPESENFRKLVTGDIITAEQKGKDPIEFNCYAKFIFSANEIPKIKDPTGATARRVIIIPFLNSFTQANKDYDPYFLDKIKNKDCMEYLIKVGIEGLKRVLKNKKFSETEKNKELLDKFNRNNNPLFEFIDYLENDSLIPMEFDYIINNYPCTAIFEGHFNVDNKQYELNGYKDWANKNGYKAISYNTFKENMCKNFGLDVKQFRKRGKQERYFIKK
ncbi:phage/plasmid primase, P4 family [Fusobacterium perfoetens]|uniref:phage/plasmid primase, P4 family n=1 Tax=Fusobacterium perfoetens TaxID=852 RepID=UPI001F379880|nr:phage/plasmid primase, P4 family [Fusobacterium perfoetens]MCF2612876.1 toprim domain-containing protein [Fusobacterium perfoetens]